MNTEYIVEFDNLQTSFFTDSGVIKAVDGVTFSIPRGSIVALVGESGCGKSVTSLSLMRLLSEPTGKITGGHIRFNAKDGSTVNIESATPRVMQNLRGNRAAMIFQEPMTSLNPVFTIGFQLDEVTALHQKKLSKKQVVAHSEKLLASVGIPDPQKTYHRYPHELSGGMRQRIMIAMALSCNPELLIADEPTTALDVTIQAQILDLLRKIRMQNGVSILLITHDLGVVAETAEFVAVMYAGRIVERGSVRSVFKNPAHPYTRGLLKSRPTLHDKKERLYQIPGQVPNPLELGEQCYFKERCDFRSACCEAPYPVETELESSHACACYRAKDTPND